MAYRKRRTAAQIRATKKLVAMNKARARGNPSRAKKKAKRTAAGQMKRGAKGLARWVRSGMPAKRNRPKGGSGRVISGYGSTVMNGKRKGFNAKRRKKAPTLTLAQGKKLWQMGKRAPKTPVAVRSNGKGGCSLVTGAAARRLRK